MKFIKKLHKHFSWPQRRAYLSKIQRENNFKVISPIHYIETRWLSLGLSLHRIILIWESLIKYMRDKPKFSGVKPATYNYFIELLEDKVFRLQIMCLTNIIDKISLMNTKFQSQSMEIQNLKNEMNKCILKIMDLYILPESPNSHLLFKRKRMAKCRISKKLFYQT